MVVQTANSFLLVFMNCFQWFTKLLNAVSGTSFWLSAVLMCALFKFIFRPVFGSCKSDLAKKSINAFKRRKEE